MILCNDDDLYKKINSAVFPGTQGGPLEHIIAAKAVWLGRGAETGVPGLWAAGGRQRRGSGGKADRAGFRLVSGGTIQPSDSGGHRHLWPHRQGV